MSRKRPLHKYPEEFYELFERAQASPFVLSFESPSRARSVRGDLYNLRAAVREHCTLDPDNEAINERYILMENIVIELDGCRLSFRKRSYVNQQHITLAKIEDVFQ